MQGIGELAEGSSTDNDDELVLKLFNTEYTEVNGRPIVHCFCRDDNAKWHHIEVDGHRPSFFIQADEYSDRIDNHYAVHHTETHDDDGERYTDLYDNPLIRIYTELPSQVADMRELFDWTGEADVFYTKRFLIDTGIMDGLRVDTSDATDDEWVTGDMRVDVSAVEPLSEGETPTLDPKIMAIDIEVASDSEVPDVDDADESVTTIVAWDSYSEQYVGWFYRIDCHNGVSPSDAADADVDDLRVFGDESALLADFNEYVAAQQPDILTGWFSNTFDIPYLINRSKNVNSWNYQDWSPLGEVYDGRFDPTIQGVSCVDMLDAYKKTQIHNLSSQGLDDIAEKEGLDGKVAVETDENVEASHTEMWKRRPIEFLRYNKVDVELVHEIDDESGATDLLDNLRSVVGCSYSDPIGGNIDMMDVLFLRKAKEYGHVLPTSTEPDVTDYHGAYVYTPEAGMHENVCYPDYSSLYPNMMYQCNISPETLVGTADDLEASEYTEDDCVWSYIDTETPPGQKEDVEPSDSEMEKVYFVDPSVESGFMRNVLDDVMGLAAQYTGDMYAAVKRVRNSCLTPDAEVLTPSGIVNITDVSVGDDVYSWNPDTEKMEVKTVTDTIERSGEETIHHIDTNGIDLKLTDDHDMWVRRYRHTDEWEKTPVGDLNQRTEYQLPHDWEMGGERMESVDIREWVDEYEVRIDPDCHGRTFAAAVDWCAEHNGNGVYYLEPGRFDAYEETVRDHADDITIQTRRKESHIPMKYSADNFIQLLAWYVTEGYIYTSDREQIGDTVRGECTTINIAQEVPEYRNEIRSLLDDMGLTYYEDSNGFGITGSTALAEALLEMCGHGSYNKRLPQWVFDVATEQRESLLETMMKGDGDSGSQKRYSTASEELRDDMCRLLVTLGETPRYSSDSGVWRVTWRPAASNGFTCERSVTKETYDGSVYCLTVEDNHTFVAGRNGNFSVVGNCYGVTGDSDSYGRGFRLYDWKIAESVTLGGQRVLKEGGEEFTELVDDEDARVIYGDTDSTVTTFPNADGPEDALEQSQTAAEELNDYLETFCVDEFGLASQDDSMMEIEVESVSDGIFFKGKNNGQSDEGVKKRYVQRVVWNDDDMWLDEPEVEITGFEYVRSDVAQITKDVQQQTFEHLLNKNLSDAEEAVKEYVTGIIHDAISGDMDDNRLGIPFGIGQDLGKYGSKDRTPQPCYRGAKYANSEIYGERAITTSSDAIYFYTQEGYTGEYRKTYSATTKEDGRYVDAISVLDADDVPDGFRIDRRKMVEKTIIGPMEAIFNTLGWGIDWAERAVEEATPPEWYRDADQKGLSAAEYM